MSGCCSRGADAPPPGRWELPDPGTVIVGVRPGADCLILNRGRVERKRLPTGVDDVLMRGELLAADNAVRQPEARGGGARRRSTANCTRYMAMAVSALGLP